MVYSRRKVIMLESAEYSEGLDIKAYLLLKVVIEDTTFSPRGVNRCAPDFLDCLAFGLLLSGCRKMGSSRYSLRSGPLHMQWQILQYDSSCIMHRINFTVLGPYAEMKLDAVLYRKTASLPPAGALMAESYNAC